MADQAARRIDLIEELGLRRWARENYVVQEKRNPAWHPVVLEEMAQKDIERQAREASLPNLRGRVISMPAMFGVRRRVSASVGRQTG
ncbi:MAG: hypothetical protein KDA42_02015 [Planctomycetales bacterium]|nr:hypothetical protein [Planctomycetales bacterium]